MRIVCFDQMTERVSAAIAEPAVQLEPLDTEPTNEREIVLRRVYSAWFRY